MKINKSFTTNLLALLTILLGHLSPIYQDQILSIGYFALSGAITNWLAIYMLFEKVPGLYGSGVIPNRFEDFKKGIHSLIMGQFFTKQNIFILNKKIIILIVLIFLPLAASNIISFGSTNILNIELNKFIYGFLASIRASGRLIFPIYYLIFLTGIIFI